MDIVNAQLLYDQNEKARRERYTSNMNYVRERFRIAVDKSNTHNQFNSDNQFNKAVKEFKRACDYYKLRDEQSFNKNKNALDNTLGVLLRRKGKWTRELQKSPA